MRVVKTRLVIITEIIAPYRIPVFNEVARNSEIDLHVIFLAEIDSGMRDWMVFKDEIRFPYEVLRSCRVRWGRHNILINRGLERALREVAPQVILCGGYNYIASWQALFWAKRNRVPFLLWAESHAQERRAKHRWTELMKRSFVRRCQGFVVPGKASREYLTAFDVRQERIFTAPNAIDNELFERIAHETRSNADEWRGRLRLPSRFFLFVGRMVEEKGVFDLLGAYAKLPPPLRTKVGLVFVGDGSARAKLERQVQAFRLDLVRFYGFVQKDSLPRFYGLADASILPTHTDAWGLVVNEAMACGVPVVCTDRAGCTADLIAENWNGYIVPARDVQKLAEVIEQLAKCPEILERMGQNGSRRIQDYSPIRCAEGISAAARAVRYLT
jgi:glycosyltransferase involved in cell wall biosynthesis